MSVALASSEASTTDSPTMDPKEAVRASSRSRDAARRDELAAFLRNRRERLSPADIGLLTSGRRRTPGLRREEVAQLAGVGVTWYTWLEQGREITPSAQVLDAIARTLRLDGHERTHLFGLADVADPTHDDGCYAVTDGVRALLDQLEPYPACVVNGRYDLLAYNRSYQAAMCVDLDALDPLERNSLWRVFTDPGTRTRLLDWDTTAPRMVASFRAAMAKHMGEPAWKCFLKRMLEASSEFAEIWERHEVAPTQQVRKRLLHPDVGLLQMESTSLWVAESVGIRLVTYTPLDDDTRSRLEQLASTRA
jgi:transcriptional regulator with XRE-family HTH domain